MINCQIWTFSPLFKKMRQHNHEGFQMLSEMDRETEIKCIKESKEKYAENKENIDRCTIDLKQPN